MLCSVCDAFFKRVEATSGSSLDVENSEIASKNQTYDYHKSGSLIQTSARDGCFVCHCVEEETAAQGVQLESSHHLNDSCLIGFREGHLNPWDCVHVSFSIQETNQQIVVSLRYQSPDISTTWHSDVPRRAAPLESKWDIARDWLRQCKENHHCTYFQDPSWVPTRLLDVSNDRVRLVSGAAIPLPSRYIALSHCWGGQLSCRLDKSNLKLFTDSIDFSSLPRTFRDAISGCRTLEIEYLWIDALCIIQDDAEDWKQQASLMSQVYSQAFCTFAASAARNSDGGLSQTISQGCIENPIIDLHSNGQDALDKKSRHEAERSHRVLVDTKLWNREVDQSPLSQRGWVVQECILSQRTLYFGKSQLFWECLCHKASTQYPSGLPDTIETIDRLKPWHMRPNELRQYLNGWEVGSCGASLFWTQIVEHYSGTSLTNPTDRLIALSGIAKKMSSLLPDQYIAGMWSRRIVFDLAWYRRHELSDIGSGDCLAEIHGKSTYLAPSFAWASLNFHAVRFEPLHEPSVQVDGVWIDSSMDGFGMVKGGHIQLKSCLKKGTIRHGNIIGKGYRQFSTSLFVEDGNAKYSLGRKRPLIPRQHFSAIMIHDDAECYINNRMQYPRSVEEEVIYCLIGSCGDRGTDAFYLMLKHHEQGDYRRLGCFIATGQRSRLLIKKLPSGGKKIPCKFYDELADLHTFTIS